MVKFALVGNATVQIRTKQLQNTSSDARVIRTHNPLVVGSNPAGPTI